MLRCKYNSLNTYDFKELIGVSILSITEFCYFIFVYVYVKRSREDKVIFNNRTYKPLRYFLGLQTLLVMFFLPFYIVYTFKEGISCQDNNARVANIPDSNYHYDIIPLIPYCFILTCLFCVYLFSFNNINHHLPTLAFYSIFFLSQLIMYSCAILIVGYKMIRCQGKHTKQEDHFTVFNILQECRLKPIMMDYVLPLSLILLPCLVFSAESVYFCIHTQDISATKKNSFSNRNNKIKGNCV